MSDYRDQTACLTCAGLGKVKPNEAASGPSAWVTCPTCGGSGAQR